MASAADAARRARRTLAPLVAATLAATVLVAADASAATTRVCRARAVVVQSPGGFTVGYLYRDARVRVTRRSASRKWSRIVTPTELRGWVRSRHLCRR
jgi:hypothetical protein